jgi:hypothetical protein
MSSPNRCQLIQPSAETPWDAQVVSVAPKRVEQELFQDSSNTTGAVTEGWASVLLQGKKLHVWPLDASLHPPKSVHFLYHPKMATAQKLMVSMTATNTTTNDVVYVHVASSDGHLCLWKIAKNERSSAVARARAPKARVSLTLEDGERVTTLTSQGHVLIVGTSHNSIWWCTVTSHPIMLQAQKVERQQGLLGRMFSTSNSARQEAIHSIQFLSPKVFLSITSSGNIEETKVTTTVAASHQATFEGTVVASLQTSLLEYASISAKSFEVLRTTLHQRSLHVILRINEQRIYWVRCTITQDVKCRLNQVQWLSRFHPEVSCVGLVTTLDHSTYATFQYEKGPVTCLAFVGDVVSEVDFPMEQVPGWIDGTLGQDFVTHGTWGLATSGLGVRSRYLTQASSPSQPAVSSTKSTTLALHLRSAFWQWYQNGGTIRLPPSVQHASPQEVEQAILATAQHLFLHDSSSKHNPAEWHASFLKMLLEGGLYRSISPQGRWALLGIGQELAVYQALHGHMTVQPHSVCKALEESQDAGPEWCRKLCLALETANTYRKEQASPLYDVMADQIPSCRVWTSQDTLQAVLRRQLQAWMESAHVPPKQVTTVVTTALASHMEASDRQVYEEVKAVAIPLIRKINNDSLAFELSKTYSWNDGLCQLALDHEKEAEFKLDDLLQNATFCLYVLKWHADRGLFHNVLNHGRHLPDLLAQFLEKDDRLRPYRWVAAVRAHNYELAATFLLDEQSGAGSLKEIRRALSMAKMCSRKRRKLIGRKLDLVKAQEILLGDSQVSLWSPDKLLSVALDRLEQDGDKDKIQTAVIALAIAGASDDRLRMAAQVWSVCISADRNRWTGWLKTQGDLTDAQLRRTILETTVFGGLWNEAQGQHEEDVCYGNAIEGLALERLGLDVLENMEMRRLLHTVTTPTSA